LCRGGTKEVSEQGGNSSIGFDHSDVIHNDGASLLEMFRLVSKFLDAVGEHSVRQVNILGGESLCLPPSYYFFVKDLQLMSKIVSVGSLSDTFVSQLGLSVNEFMRRIIVNSRNVVSLSLHACFVLNDF